MTETACDWTCPDSELVPVSTTDRAAWLEARRQGIGGSDISGILNMSRWSSARQVWLDKLGLTPDQPPTWAMRKGNALEPALLENFTAQTGITTRPAGLQRNTTNPWMQVTLDGMTDDGGIIECKVTNWHLAYDWDADQIADHAELQAQWGLAVTGRTHAWVTAAISDDDPIIRRRERDQNLIDTLIDVTSKFWHTNVLEVVEPPAVAADLPSLRRHYAHANRKTVVGGPLEDQLLEQYASAASMVKLYEGIKDDAAAALLATFKDADHLAINGEVAATWKSQTARRLSAQLLAADGIDVEQYKAETTTRVLRVPAKRTPTKGN